MIFRTSMLVVLFQIFNSLTMCKAEEEEPGTTRNKSSRRFYFKRDAQLVEDYVAFYGFRHIYIMHSGGETNIRWALRITSGLTLRPTSDISVLPVKEREESEHLNSRQVNRSLTTNLKNVTLNYHFDFFAITKPPMGTVLVVGRLHGKKELHKIHRILANNSGFCSWLLLTDFTTLKSLKTVYFPIDNKIVLATSNKEGTISTLWEVLQVTETLPQTLWVVGRWWAMTPETPAWNITTEVPRALSYLHEGGFGTQELYISPENIGFDAKMMKYGRIMASLKDTTTWRNKLSGLHLKCVTIEAEPFTMLQHQSDGKQKTVGVFISLMDTMAERYNFTYKCHEVSDGQWGAILDGKWTGMIRELLDDKADIIIAPLDITLQRSEVVDYLVALTSGGYKMVVRRPSTHDHVWTAYTRLFSTGIWLLVIATMVILIIVFYFSMRLSKPRQTITALDSFTMITGFACEQGTHLQPSSTTGRMVMITGVIFFKMVLAYYTSVLISSLACGTPDPDLKTLRDVLNKPLTLGLPKGMATLEYFKESSDDLHQQVWQSLQKNNFADLSPDLASGIERVKNEPYVLMDWEIRVEYKFGTDCKLFFIPTSYFVAKSSIALRKGSPYTSLLDKSALEMYSSGFLDKWWKEWRHPVEKICQVETKPIELRTIFTVVALLSTGAVLSIFFLLLEIYYANQIRSRDEILTI